MPGRAPPLRCSGSPSVELVPTLVEDLLELTFSESAQREEISARLDEAETLLRAEKTAMTAVRNHLGSVPRPVASSESRPRGGRRNVTAEDDDDSEPDDDSDSDDTCIYLLLV